MSACATQKRQQPICSISNKNTTMKRLTIFNLALALCIYSLGALGQNPKAKTGVFALTNANIQTVTNGVISNGTIVLSGGKIADLGTGITPPAGATVIDCKG